MTKPAAISAQLVDYKNDPQHKGFIRVTLHVPEEGGAALTESFPWPSFARPIPVALARLRDTDAGDSAGQLSPDREAVTDTPPVAASRSPRKPVAPEKRLVVQAAICCADPVFQRYMVDLGMASSTHEYTVAQAVRNLCAVASRSQLIPNTPEGDLWQKLYGQFLIWRDHDIPAAGEAA